MKEISINFGGGFLGITFLVLLILKAGIGNTEAINWSWWIITLPLWIIPASVTAMILIGLICVGIGLFCCFIVDRFRQ